MNLLRDLLTEEAVQCTYVLEHETDDDDPGYEFTYVQPRAPNLRFTGRVCAKLRQVWHDWREGYSFPPTDRRHALLKDPFIIDMFTNRIRRVSGSGNAWIGISYVTGEVTEVQIRKLLRMIRDLWFDDKGNAIQAERVIGEGLTEALLATSPDSYRISLVGERTVKVTAEHDDDGVRTLISCFNRMLLGENAELWTAFRRKNARVLKTLHGGSQRRHFDEAIVTVQSDADPVTTVNKVFLEFKAYLEAEADPKRLSTHDFEITSQDDELTWLIYVDQEYGNTVAGAVALEHFLDVCVAFGVSNYNRPGTDPSLLQKYDALGSIFSRLTGVDAVEDDEIRIHGFTTEVQLVLTEGETLTYKTLLGAFDVYLNILKGEA